MANNMPQEISRSIDLVAVWKIFTEAVEKLPTRRMLRHSLDRLLLSLADNRPARDAWNTSAPAWVQGENREMALLVDALGEGNWRFAQLQAKAEELKIFKEIFAEFNAPAPLRSALGKRFSSSHGKTFGPWRLETKGIDRHRRYTIRPTQIDNSENLSPHPAKAGG